MTPKDQVLSTKVINLPQKDKVQGNKKHRWETEDDREGKRNREGGICWGGTKNYIWIERPIGNDSL